MEALAIPFAAALSALEAFLATDLPAALETLLVEALAAFSPLAVLLAALAGAAAAAPAADVAGCSAEISAVDDEELECLVDMRLR